MSDQIKFRFRVADEERRIERGCTGYFVTNRLVTEKQVARLKDFWARKPALQDGEIITI